MATTAIAHVLIQYLKQTIENGGQVVTVQKNPDGTMDICQPQGIFPDATVRVQVEPVDQDEIARVNDLSVSWQSYEIAEE